MPHRDIKARDLKFDKNVQVSDFDGLFDLIRERGANSWRFKYRIDGKEDLLAIGDFPAVTLAKAPQALKWKKRRRPKALIQSRPGKNTNVKGFSGEVIPQICRRVKSHTLQWKWAVMRSFTCPKSLTPMSRTLP